MRLPTVNQFNDPDNYPRLNLTSETLTWDPWTDLYQEQEAAMTDLTGNIVTHATARGQQPSFVINSIFWTYTDLLDIIHDDNLHEALSSHIDLSRSILALT